ncbi:class I SAM-dependent methyltransferase [Arthrobacter citreus]|uniref:Class I SAM-dependent methyltransferase n=1 Tax=Arthrobacter citreus TaxID=1670 RepID=A0ABZ2ZVV0_9MICC
MEPGNYYATPELAAAYDADSAGRRDLDFHLELAAGLNAVRVADIGAGTGLLCSMLAGAGHEVAGVEPQRTMLDIAQRQEHAAAVLWLHGTAERLPAGWADLVVMTGHVAQYFLDDAAWAEAAAHAKRALRPGGRLTFEVRNPSVEAWRTWPTAGRSWPARSMDRGAGPGTGNAPGRGIVSTEVRREGDLITHLDTWTMDHSSWTTTETLRFPSKEAVLAGLESAGSTVDRIWGDWDRSPVTPQSPEWIFLTHPV